MWEISTEKEKKNLVFRWTQIYSQMNHKCHALKELCPESSFSCWCRASDFVVHCLHLSLTDIPLESSVKFQRNFPLACACHLCFIMLPAGFFTFRKENCVALVIILGWNICVSVCLCATMCVCTHMYMHIQRGMCVYICLYISLYRERYISLYMFVYISWSIFTGQEGKSST